MAALPRSMNDSNQSSSGNEVGGGRGVDDGKKNENNKPASESECIAYNNSLNNNVLVATRGGAPLGLSGPTEVVGSDGAGERRRDVVVVVKTKGAMKCGDAGIPVDAPFGIVNHTFYGSEARPEDDVRKLLHKDSTPKTTPSKTNEHKSSSSRNNNSSSSTKSSSSSSRRGS